MNFVSKHKYYLLTLTLVIVATATTTFFVVNNQQKNSSEDSEIEIEDIEEEDKPVEITQLSDSEITQAEINANPIYNDWLTYTNEIFGIKFKYPINYEVEFQQQEDLLYIKMLDFPAGSGEKVGYITFYLGPTAKTKYEAYTKGYTLEKDEKFPNITIANENYEVLRSQFIEGLTGDDGCGHLYIGSAYNILPKEILFIRVGLSQITVTCNGIPNTEYTPNPEELETAKLILQSIEFI